MAIKEGKILSVQPYIDTSWNGRVSSVKVVIEYGSKIIDTYKYGYYGEDLKVGDIVKFEAPGFFDVGTGLKVLVKKG